MTAQGETRQMRDYARHADTCAIYYCAACAAGVGERHDYVKSSCDCGLGDLLSEPQSQETRQLDPSCSSSGEQKGICGERFYEDDPFVVCTLSAAHEGEHRCGDEYAWSEPLMLRNLRPFEPPPREPHAALIAEIETATFEDGFSGGPDKRKSTRLLEAWCPECSAYQTQGHDSDCRWSRDHHLLRRALLALKGTP